jgi:cytochrome P450/glutathione S-transferase
MNLALTRLRERPGNRLFAAPLDPPSEVARWVLERLGFEYREEAGASSAAPIVPRLVTPEVSLAGPAAILDYYEARSPQAARLYPADPARRTELEGLVRVFLTELAPAVAALARDPASPPEAARAVDTVFERVNERLADGRRYLAGDHFSAADLVFAAVGAFVVAPAELGPPLPAPVPRLRDSPAGLHVQRLYRELRVGTLNGRRLRDLAPSARPAFGGRVKEWAGSLSTAPGLLRFVFGLLRRWKPVFTIAGKTIVTRRADVLEILERDRDFTIAEINDANMRRVSGAFILGMDRSPEYEREAGFLRGAVRRDDPERIRGMVAEEAARLTAAARAHGRLDVVGMLARVVATRLLDRYFGVPGPSEQLLARWMRALFWDLFLNGGREAKVEEAANACGKDLHLYLDGLIAERRQELAGGSPGRDDFLSRLVAASPAPGTGLDDDGIRRNISGLIVGAVDTTVTATANAIDQLLRRPHALAAAREAALRGDVEAVSRCTFEALRFNPQTPAVLRFCRQDATVGKDAAAAHIPGGTQVVVATLSAMFDPSAFTRPHEFQADRSPQADLHFGGGLHTCFGRYVNMVQIPELVKAVVALKNLRRAPGAAGQMVYEGPFPDQLVVEFDG